MYFSVACLALRKCRHTWLYFCALQSVSFCPIFHNWSMLNLWPTGPFCYQPATNFSFMHQPSAPPQRFRSDVSSYCGCEGLCVWGPYSKSAFLHIPFLDLCFLQVDLLYFLEAPFFSKTNYYLTSFN